MRFGETRDPAPTTMEELAPGGLLARLSRMDVLARRAVRGARSGERRSRKRGGGLEFAEHRDYEPGDDLRFVDWNVFARLDRLVTKVFIEEEDLTVALMLDASASMDWGNPNKFLFARRMSLCLGVMRCGRGTDCGCTDLVVRVLQIWRGFAGVLELYRCPTGFWTHGPVEHPILRDRWGKSLVDAKAVEYW